MCGIVALVDTRGRPVQQRLLSEMAESLAHRGPDDRGELVEGSVGLAHQRLAIIDLSGGRQPMTAGPATVVLNGEIYNYRELRAELETRGHVFRTSSDTEVLLRLYLERGPDCVRALIGMFAFVIYDRARRRVMAARDHFGVKPLYVCASGGLVAFASEIKALLRRPDLEPEVAPAAVQAYVTFQYVPGTKTLFRGVEKVPPAHYLLVDLDGDATERVRYWRPSFEVDAGLDQGRALAELRALLEDSVRLQMRSDVPVGAYLSGGIDSGVVTALAARHAGPRFKTFTAAFREGSEYDERPYARAVATRYGAEVHEVFPTEDELISLLPRLVYHMDEPAAGPGLFPQYVVSREAARHVKVVLGGQGGDEIFAGYARYVVAYLEQALKGAIFETNEEGEHIVSLQSLLPNLPVLRAYGPMLQQFWSDGLFEDMDRRYFRLVDRSGGSLDLFGPEFRASYDGEAMFESFRVVFDDPETRSYYNKMTHYDMLTSLPALLQVEDRVSMAVSLESRVPLLDHRIVDLVTRTPPRTKFEGGELKFMLKRACRDLLPPLVLGRKDKMGFPVPLHGWMQGRFGDFVRDVFGTAAARQRGLFDRTAIDALLRRGAAFDRRLWGVLNLELWHQQFIDARGRRSNRMPR